MAIEYRGNRAYYYRKIRDGDRVRSEYVGGGELAPLAREVDRMEWDLREVEWLEEAVEVEEAETMDRLMQAHFDAVEAVAREAIEAAGYRRHKRGEWRKSRGRRDD